MSIVMSIVVSLRILETMEFRMSIVMSVLISVVSHVFQIIETMELVSSSLEKDDVDAIFWDPAFHARPAHWTETLSITHEEPLVDAC